MKIQWPLTFVFITVSAVSLGCKPVGGVSEIASESGLAASLADHTIFFAGTSDAKIGYCDSPSDTIEPLVKEDARADWKSPTLAEKSGIYIMDGELEVFEANEPCSQATNLISVTNLPVEIAKTVQVPMGHEPIGEEKLKELKKIDPETALTAESLIPVFKSAPARFAKVDFALLKADGSPGERFSKEFELR